MNKIIFAAALLAVLTLTIAIGVTTSQQANAVITYKEDCHHTDEQCMMNDAKNTIGNMIKGLFARDNN
jgi:hypothetical protein